MTSRFVASDVRYAMTSHNFLLMFHSKLSISCIDCEIYTYMMVNGWITL